ncbi:MAG: hypothetical protein CM15mP125_0230 [Gammaproteobacteria bacterium]|nr:MAG: hypothetical protein CM15mP125_0230 [Gammaproteobacteria bacterium]
MILMLPSMFHANAWGFPYSGWMSGADMVMPGPHLQGPHLRTMIESARPTLTAMVPTLLGDLLLRMKPRRWICPVSGPLYREALPYRRP